MTFIVAKKKKSFIIEVLMRYLEIHILSYTFECNGTNDTKPVKHRLTYGLIEDVCTK